MIDQILTLKEVLAQLGRAKKPAFTLAVEGKVLDFNVGGI